MRGTQIEECSSVNYVTHGLNTNDGVTSKNIVVSRDDNMPHLTPYQKGYIREVKAKQLMESWFGCHVIRSAGSHSPIDLLCGNGVEMFAVQVKMESDEHTVKWDVLREWAQSFQATPTLLVYCRGGRWKVYFDGERWTKFTEEQPSVR